MASTLLPLLLLTSTLGEQPRDPFFDSGFSNFGLQRSPYFYNPYPPRDLFPSFFGERNPFEFSWPSVWKDFHELIHQNFLDKNGLNIVLNVQGYKPDELEVRVVTRQVIVRGNHVDEVENNNNDKNNENSNKDNNNNNNNNNHETEVVRPSVSGQAVRQFERRYVVPANVDLDKITTEVSSDGILTIRAPFKDVPKEEEGKKVTIEQTGKPALKPKDTENKQQPHHQVETNDVKKVDIKPSKEPESREDDSNNKESIEAKKNTEENDIDGVSITTAPEEATTPLK